MQAQLIAILVGFVLAIAVLAAAWLVMQFAKGVRRGEKARKGPELTADGGHPVSPARLLIASTSGEVLCLDSTASPLRVGQAPDNDLVVTTAMLGWDTVSRHHARLYYDNHRSRWVVKDEGSSNGTYVAGARTGHNVLQDGVRVAFGGMEAVFRQAA
ncbi:MAG: FHA domain-containing protein [Chloroflexota bacterium]|nr:FHA domain-containing protein [Chloroflexota bacterium]